jgi:hypothetical protein
MTEMTETMEILKFLPLLFIAAAAIIVFGAKKLVKKYGMDKNVKCEYEDQMTVEELESYKFDKAVVNLKMFGLLIALPGVVLVMVLFR